MHGRSDDDDVVGQEHRERLVADEVLGHEHRVAEAQLLLLAHVGDLGEVADRADLAQLLDLALLLEQVLQLVVEVEVVLDHALLRGGDDDHLLDAGGDGLLDRVLDHRLVHQGQHLLGLRLRGGQEPGAPAGGGEDSLADAHRTSRAGSLGGALSIPASPRRTLAAAGRDAGVPCVRRASVGRRRPGDRVLRGVGHDPREGRRAVEVREVERPRDADAGGPAGAVAAHGSPPGPKTGIERAVDDRDRRPQPPSRSR